MRFTSVLCLPNHILYTYNIYHLFTETEGNSVFCGPETAVSIYECQSMNNSPVIGVNLI
jgi:hypothetical protein